MSRQISVTLPDAIAEKLDLFVQLNPDMSQSSIAADAIAKGLNILVEEYNKDEVFKRFAQKKLSGEEGSIKD